MGDIDDADVLSDVNTMGGSTLYPPRIPSVQEMEQNVLRKVTDEGMTSSNEEDEDGVRVYVQGPEHDDVVNTTPGPSAMANDETLEHLDLRQSASSFVIGSKSAITLGADQDSSDH